MIRHDAAHMLAMAVQELYPGTQVTIGPPIEDGFYYDFARRSLSCRKTCPRSRRKMHEIMKADLPVHREVWPRAEASRTSRRAARIQGRNDPRPAQGRGRDGLLSRPNGTICAAGRISLRQARSATPSSSPRSRAPIGAAMPSDAQLQRIYGTAWRDEKELEAYLRSSRKPRSATTASSASELELFTFSPDVGAGLPLWMPNGMVIRQELEFLAAAGRAHRRLQPRRHAAHHQGGAVYPFAPSALLPRGHVFADRYRRRELLPAADELPASSHDLSGDAAFLSRTAAAASPSTARTIATKRPADCPA